MLNLFEFVVRYVNYVCDNDVSSEVMSAVSSFDHALSSL